MGEGRSREAQTPPVDVVAGVIRDKAGRILLARRTEGRDLAGLWEFPGGKREPGESPEAALARELHEELGIDIDCGAPLIAVPQRYPHKRLRLDVRMVGAWRGTVKGLDGQALAWAPPHTLASYQMPPADIPVVAALLQPDRYLVTPAPDGSDAAWLESLERALDAGIRRVQLRAPHCASARWTQLVEAAVDACRRHGAEVLVNGDIALAQALRIGVHLRAAQLMQLDVRPLAEGMRVGASCHTLDELRRAESLGCDFAVVGPVADTLTHPDATPLGWTGFAALREEVALPMYAIGGMGAQDIDVARAHGAQGIAAIRGLWPT
ncbi:Nudix family hydrolase [Lysobacter sp. A6]|uniref:8-oxo-dGTP diphosphatase n=1 Tax=Noviluteimonas lactosilytica TaxID=2888523 RepID=A0ABS8JFX8_9GAMM|nr:Nudix family hydrolase [Lysobacter lactosilyticus]MCC8362511.1 Nudix family hydrolase [Lysobacter lactosilyticus]